MNCLDSLVKNSTDDIKLLIHTDGSLSANDESSLCLKFGSSVEISDFGSSKECALDHLKNRPNCQKIRKESIWGIEFFDPIFAFPNDQISFYLDADILFLRPFSGLFDREQVKNGAVFLKDTQWDAYSYRPWQMLTGKSKLKSVKGITTGMVFWDKKAIDWDYLEWFLGEYRFHQIPEWIMPTAQAGLADRCDAKTISSRHITNLYPNAQIHKDTFGVHMLSSYRKEWMEKLDAEKYIQGKNSSIIVPSFEKCVSQNIVGYSFRQMRRWKNTRLNLW